MAHFNLLVTHTLSRHKLNFSLGKICWQLTRSVCMCLNACQPCQRVLVWQFNLRNWQCYNYANIKAVPYAIGLSCSSRYALDINTSVHICICVYIWSTNTNRFAIKPCKSGNHTAQTYTDTQLVLVHLHTPTKQWGGNKDANMHFGVEVHICVPTRCTYVCM